VIEIIKKLPIEFVYYPGESNNAPNGYRLAYNKESRWSKDVEYAWVPDYRQRAYWESK